MPLTAMEVAMQTMGCVLSEYAKKEDCDIKLTEGELCRLVHEQCQNFKQPQGETHPGVYRLRIPLNKSIQGPLCSRCPADRINVDAMNSKMCVRDNKLVIDSNFR